MLSSTNYLPFFFLVLYICNRRVPRIWVSFTETIILEPYEKSEMFLKIVSSIKCGNISKSNWLTLKLIRFYDNHIFVIKLQINFFSMLFFWAYRSLGQNKILKNNVFIMVFIVRVFVIFTKFFITSENMFSLSYKNAVQYLVVFIS